MSTTGGTTSNSFAHTASTLRWRARLTKEATTTPNDDSNVHWLSQTSVSSDSLFSDRKPQQDPPPQRRPRVQRMIVSSCFLCLASSWVSLWVTRTWFFAVSATLNIFHAVWLLRQRYKLQGATAVNEEYLHQKRRVHSLRLQNERLLRQVRHGEEQAERMQYVERQLRQWAQGTHDDGTQESDASDAMDSKRITTTVLAYRKMHQRLQDLLVTQVQATILKALILAHHPPQHNSREQSAVAERLGKYYLMPHHIDALVGKLRSIPGITSVRRDYMDDVCGWNRPTARFQSKDGASTTESGTSVEEDRRHAYRAVGSGQRHTDQYGSNAMGRPKTSIVPRMLQQVETDASVQSIGSSTNSTRLAFGTTPRGTHTFWTPYRTDALHQPSKHDPQRTKDQKAVVFGMDIREMAISTLKKDRQHENSNGWSVDGGNILTSPKGSLHSC